MSSNIEKISETLAFLRVPNPFRDVIILLTGFCTLSLLYVNSNAYRFSIDGNILIIINKFTSFGRVENVLIVLAASYIVGRFLGVVADFFILPIIYVSKRLATLIVKGFAASLKDLTKAIKQSWRKILAEFFDPQLGHVSMSQDDVRYLVSSVEKFQLIEKTPNISAELERSAYQQIFLQNSVGMFLVCTVLVNNYYFIPFLICLFGALREYWNNQHRDYSIYKAVVHAGAVNPIV